MTTQDFTMENERLRKRLSFRSGALAGVELTNLRTGVRTSFPDCEEFVIVYREGEVRKTLQSTRCRAVVVGPEEVAFAGNGITVTERYRKTERDVFKRLTVCAGREIFVEQLVCDTYPTAQSFCWHSRVSDVDLSPFGSVVKPFLLSLGQPVYFRSYYTALVFPAAENTVAEQRVSLRLHLGRTLAVYRSCEVVLGAGAAEGYDAVREAFFEYVSTFARAQKVFMTYNSWFDHLLKIDEAKILSSFQRIYEGFRDAGLRPLDCYVVDDGWNDRTKREFWGFDDSKFPGGFARVSELTRQLGSGFGVWFGPRGGYEHTVLFAEHLEEMGYPKNRVVGDICVGSPRYIHDLCAKMRAFMTEYGASYFKIDGFALLACDDPNHGHPVGGRDGIYFYTYLYERWMEELASLRELNPDVFLNLTTYTHSSPFFLQVAGSLWINNSYDFGFSGRGDSLEACLTYKDHKYYDLMCVQQAQIPPQYIYNHEPIYANERTDTRLPEEERQVLQFSDEQFEKYLYACVMRGSGFLEFYYSYDRLAEGEKFRINTRVCAFLEEHFEALSRVRFHGGNPEEDDVYGFFGQDEREALLSVRNPSAERKTYCLKLPGCAGDTDPDEIYNRQGCDYRLEGGTLRAALPPYGFLILKISK